MAYKTDTSEFENRARVLRLSLTGECNLKCFYCRPMGKSKDLFEINKHIQPSDVTKLVKISGDLGIRKVWIQGGEPLLRKDAPNFVKSAHAFKGIEEVRLFTNGTFLKAYADPLRKYGLRKVDVNLDSMDFKKFQRITGSDSLYRVLDGIEKVEKLNYTDIRVNILLLDKINNDEIVAMSRLIKDRKIHIRFLEYHPAVNVADPYAQMEHNLTPLRAKRLIDNYQKLVPIDDLSQEFPVPTYTFRDSIGKISFLTRDVIDRERSVPRILLSPEGILTNEAVSGKSLDVVEQIRKDPKSPKLHAAIANIMSLEPKKKSSTSVSVSARATTKKTASKKAKRVGTKTASTISLKAGSSKKKTTTRRGASTSRRTSRSRAQATA